MSPGPAFSARKSKFPLDPDCLIFLLPLGVIGAIGWVWAVWWIWIPALVASLAIMAFFRDPPRKGPSIEGAILSPADGKVVEIVPNEDPLRGPVPGVQIAIFLSVLDCHINRAPCAGVVEKIRYERGLFLDARDPQSGHRNECNWIFMRCGKNQVTVRQIAGLIARRIVCRVREGQDLKRGERIGLIRFGSRTELYLPAEAEIKVKIGDRVAGGRSVVAVWVE